MAAENPIHNAKDFFNQEDYDRLVKEGVTDFAPYSSLPVPDDPDVTAASKTPRVTSTIPTASQTPSQRGGISRRDFFWGGIVLGVAAIGGLAYVSRNEQDSTGVTIATKPTLAPVIPTQSPVATFQTAAKPTEAKPAQILAQSPTLEVKPTPKPITPTVEAKPTPTLILTPEQAKLVEARNIFGEYFFGPEAVEKTFGISLKSEEIPKIQFDKSELERAKELGQLLILRLDREPDGSALTMHYMVQKLQPQFDRDRKENILTSYGSSPRYQDFYTKEVPRRNWALVTNYVIPGSVNKNYLTQTQILADYIESQVFLMRPKVEYKAAIEEFDSMQAGITKIIENNWPAAANKLVNLKLNQLARHSPAEALYDYLVYFQNTGRRFLEGWGISTNRQTGDNHISHMSFLGSHGMYFKGVGPGDSEIGLVLSRL